MTIAGIATRRLALRTGACWQAFAPRLLRNPVGSISSQTLGAQATCYHSSARLKTPHLAAIRHPILARQSYKWYSSTDASASNTSNRIGTKLLVAILVASGTTFGILYLASTDPQLKTYFIQYVPEGDEILKKFNDFLVLLKESRQKLDNVLVESGQSLNNAKESAQQTWSEWSEKVSSTYQNVSEKTLSTIAQAKDTATQVSESASQTWNSTKTNVQKATTTVSKGLGSGLDAISAIIDVLTEYLRFFGVKLGLVEPPPPPKIEDIPKFHVGRSKGTTMEKIQKEYVEEPPRRKEPDTPIDILKEYFDFFAVKLGVSEGPRPVRVEKHYEVDRSKTSKGTKQASDVVIESTPRREPEGFLDIVKEYFEFFGTKLGVVEPNTPPNRIKKAPKFTGNMSSLQGIDKDAPEERVEPAPVSEAEPPAPESNQETKEPLKPVEVQASTEPVEPQTPIEEIEEKPVSKEDQKVRKPPKTVALNVDDVTVVVDVVPHAAESDVPPHEPLLLQPGPVSAPLALLDDYLSTLPSDDKVLRAKEQLAYIASHVDDLVATESQIAAEIAEEAEEIFEETVTLIQQGWQNRIKDLESEHQQALQNLITAKDKETRAKLETQERELRELLDQALQEQERSLTTQFSREIKMRLDSERQGRLARLDELTFKLMVLEKLTVDFANANVRAKGLLGATNALNVVKKAVKTGDESELTKCLDILEREAKQVGGYTREIVHHVLSSLSNKYSRQGETQPLSTVTSLQTSFEHVASRVRSTALMPQSLESTSLFSYLVSNVLSYFMIRKVVAPGMPEWEGNDVESIVARTEYYLYVKQDLDSAARELNSLKGWPKILARDWLNDARKRLEVEQAVNVIDTQLKMVSLGVVV